MLAAAAAVLVALPPAAGAAPPAPVGDALALIAQGRTALANGWRYRETISGTRGSEHLAYDAGRPAGRRWRLLSVNGQSPKPSQRKQMTAGAAAAARRSGGPSLTGSGWLAKSRFRLVQTLPGKLVYQVEPRPSAAGSAATRKLLHHLSGRLVLARSDHRPLELTLDNFESFSPRFGVSVHAFRFRASFKRLGRHGPVVVTRTSSTVHGKVFWLKSFSESTQVKLSGFAPVPASAGAPAGR